jgi:hypothetical protein
MPNPGTAFGFPERIEALAQPLLLPPLLPLTPVSSKYGRKQDNGWRLPPDLRHSVRSRMPACGKMDK